MDGVKELCDCRCCERRVETARRFGDEQVDDVGRD